MVCLRQGFDPVLSNDLCEGSWLCLFLGRLTLKLLVSACLVLLHQVGAREKLTLRRCHRTEFSVMHKRVFFSPPGQPNETSVSLGHVQAQPLAEARWAPAYDPEAGPQGK